MFVIQKKPARFRNRGWSYFMGLGGPGLNKAQVYWGAEPGDLAKAERFDTHEDAMDHAKMLFPAAVSHHEIVIVSVPESGRVEEE